MVSHRDRQRTLPDHGYLVADRNRWIYDFSAADHAAQTRFSNTPLFGIDVDVVDDDGESVAPGEEGILVIKKPWPGMLRTVLNDPDRYKNQYWSRFGNMYEAGDSARKDKDGYIWVIGRIDDVLKVSGYRLGTAEVESALVSHEAVSEAAAIGLPHELKGNAIYTYVICAPAWNPATSWQRNCVST